MDSSLIRSFNLSVFAGALWAGLFASGAVQAGPILTYAGKTVRWNVTATSAPLNVFVDSSASTLSTAISEALNEWSTVSGSFLQLTTTGSQSSAQIVIGVGALSNSFSSGYATPSYTSNGDLVSCTVTLGSDALAATADQARNLVMHEVGHCLGLVHSTVRNAVMSYRDGGAHLTDDDRLALVRLYPSDGSQDLPLGCATVAGPSTPSGSGPGPGWLLTAGLGLVLAWASTRPRLRSVVTA